MQKYAEEAVSEHLGRTLQKSFDRDLRSKRNKPFSNDVDKETRDRVMKQARRWSDRYRLMKKEGASEAEILKSFSVPTQMRLFSWKKKGYIDTTMPPDDVGGPNYRYFKYDNVRQGKRQIGSTVKPFLYTLAMQSGMTPCTKVVNVPQTFIVGENEWTPRSTDKDIWIGKTVTLKWGLTHSSNNISAYLMKQLGPEPMANMMKAMGIQSHIDAVPSLCVGPADLSLYEMVAAYNTFPSRGVYIAPQFVTRIEDNQGNVLGEFTNRKREAISEQTAYLMENLMQGVINNGTGARLRSVYQLKGEIAGKTGTTNYNADGWFMGFTPNLVSGVGHFHEEGVEGRYVGHFRNRQVHSSGRNEH